VTVSDSTLHPVSLDHSFDPRNYPSARSDIAALMVFGHQARMMNLITRVGWESRVAAAEGRTVSSDAPLRAAVNELVDYLLFIDEEPLPAAVRSTSPFAAIFSAQGPVDSRGRSLRQLDLEHRLLRYPCSYMIYSAAFRALSADVRNAIYTRIWDVLFEPTAAGKYARLSADDRRAIAEILRDTLPDLPDAFRASPVGAPPVGRGR
jgi:hypothetical protein